RQSILCRGTCAGRSCNFFFQAEDGIRDFHVTGVQTCALPISIALFFRSAPAYWTGMLAIGLLSYKFNLFPAGRIRSVGYEAVTRSEEHTSELQSRENLVCRLLLEKKKTTRGTARSRHSYARGP